MFKPLRIILAGLAAFAILAIVVLIGLFVYVDSVARRGLEAGGTHALGVETTVRSVDVGIIRGTLGVHGLSIANPGGFTAPTFLTMEDGRTTVAVRSFRQEVIRIPQLLLTDVDVNLERRADGSANYQVILDHLERFSRPETPRRAPDEPEQRIIINELVITNITVHASIAGAGIVGDVVGDRARATIPISEIRLEDVGRTGEGVAGSGVTPGELAALLVEAILAAAIQQGGDLLPEDLLGDLRQRLARAGNLDRLTVMVKDLTGELERVVSPEDVGDAIRRGTEGVRDLIPGRRDGDR